MPDLETRIVVDDDSRAGFESLKRRSREASDSVREDFDAAGDSATGFADVLGGGGGGIGLGVAGAAAAAGGALVAFGAQLLENANQLRAVSFETGHSIEEVQRYEQALRAQGFTVDEAREQIKSMEQAQLDLALATAEASGKIDESRIITEENIETLAEAQQSIDEFTTRLNVLGTEAFANAIEGARNLSFQYAEMAGHVFPAVEDAVERNIAVIQDYEAALHGAAAAAITLAAAQQTSFRALPGSPAALGAVDPNRIRDEQLLGRFEQTRQRSGLVLGLNFGDRNVAPGRAGGGFAGGGGRAGAARGTRTSLGDFLVNQGILDNSDIAAIGRFAPGDRFGGANPRLNFGQDISGLGGDALNELVLDVLDRLEVAANRESQAELARRRRETEERERKALAAQERTARELARMGRQPCPPVNIEGSVIAEKDAAAFVERVQRQTVPNTNPFDGATDSG